MKAACGNARDYGLAVAKGLQPHIDLVDPDRTTTTRAVMFDSVVAGPHRPGLAGPGDPVDINASRMYIVYKNASVYPAFVVTYARKAKRRASAAGIGSAGPASPVGGGKRARHGGVPGGGGGSAARRQRAPALLCDWCGADVVSGRRAARCEPPACNAVYCDADCKDTHWANGHDAGCAFHAGDAHVLLDVDRDSITSPVGTIRLDFARSLAVQGLVEKALAALQDEGELVFAASDYTLADTRNGAPLDTGKTLVEQHRQQAGWNFAANEIRLGLARRARVIPLAIQVTISGAFACTRRDPAGGAFTLCFADGDRVSRDTTVRGLLRQWCENGFGPDESLRCVNLQVRVACGYG